MLTFLPILLTLAYGLAMYRFSVWRTLKTLDANSRILDEPEITALTTRMAQALDLPQVTVHLYDVDIVNGLAAPDGRVFLTRGFLNQYRSGKVTAEELASVIAHELGHVALGHARRRMIDFTGQNALMMILSTFLSRLIPGVGVLIARTITVALAAHLSRSDEHEADAYASALLVKSGIGTGAQKSLFHKLGALTGSPASGIPAWLMSHPGTEDRIRAIEAREARWFQT
ncbi:MAG: M48 family metallopeptidase [Rhodobacter sp.]|nr:M48 family metallopeptidase [Rhodobacter sp.]